MILGKSLYTIIAQVFWDSELIESVELCLGDGLEMVGQLVVPLPVMTLLLRSPRTELFQLVDVYSKDGFEIGYHW